MMKGDEFNRLYGDMGKMFNKNKKKSQNNNKDTKKKEENDSDNNNIIKNQNNKKEILEKKSGKKISEKKQIKEEEEEKEKMSNRKTELKFLKKNEKMMKLLNIELSDEMKNNLLLETEILKNDNNKNLKMDLPKKFKDDEILKYLFTKINRYVEIRKYIIKNFKNKREKDINYLDEKINMLKLKLTEKNKKENFSDFKKNFPELKIDFILGMTKKEKKKKVKEIKNIIKKELKNLKANNKKTIYHDLFYTNFLAKLKKIEEDDKMALSITKQIHKVHYKEVYKSTTQRGEMLIKIKKFHLIKKSRYYFLKIGGNFILDNYKKKLDLTTNYSNEEGKLSYEKKITLVASDLRDQISKSKVIFELHKKKILFSRLVDTLEINLEDILLSENDFKLDFKYKDDNRMIVDVNFSIDFPLGDDVFVDLELFDFDNDLEAFVFLNDEDILKGDEEEKMKFVINVNKIVEENGKTDVVQLKYFNSGITQRIPDLTGKEEQNLKNENNLNLKEEKNLNFKAEKKSN